MVDADAHAQTMAAIEQAHAAWAQVWVAGISALATFVAVLVALGIPLQSWWRQKSFTEDTLLQAVRVIVSLHETLETKLLLFSPGGGLSVIRIARKRIEHTIPIVHEYRMITCLLALMPILGQIEQELERWALNVGDRTTYDPDEFRKGMKEQAQKASAILHGYGNRRIEQKLESIAKPFG